MTPQEVKILKNMQGYIQFILNTHKAHTFIDVVSTIGHDVRESLDYKDQPWFCPRTDGYARYLKGARQ